MILATVKTINLDVPKQPITGNAIIDSVTYLVVMVFIILLLYSAIKLFLYFKFEIPNKTQALNICKEPENCRHIDKVNARMDLNDRDYKYFKDEFKDLKEEIKNMDTRHTERTSKLYSKIDALTIEILKLTKDIPE